MEIVERLDNTQSTSTFRAIRRLITHTVMFVQTMSDHKDPGKFSRIPGLCTRLTYDKSLSELPTGDVEFSLLQLAQIEHSLKRGDNYFDELSERLCNSKFLAVRCFAWDLRIRKAILAVSFEDTILALSNYQRVMVQEVAARASGAGILDEASTETLEAETNDAFAKESVVGLALGVDLHRNLTQKYPFIASKIDPSAAT